MDESPLRQVTNVAVVDGHDQQSGVGLSIGGAGIDPVPSGDANTGDVDVVGHVVGGIGAAGDLDGVVVAEDQTRLVQVHDLVPVVRRQVGRPGDVHAPVGPAVLGPR